MLYIIYGEDDFSIVEVLTEIKEQLGDQAMLATNTTAFQAQSTTPEELMATCDTIPFLAPKRLVIVEGLLGLFEQREKGPRPPKTKGSGWLSIKEYVERMPDTTVLVLVDGRVRKSNALLAQLNALAKVVTCPPLGETQLLGWVMNRAKKRGGDIPKRAARLLVDLIGGNLWILSSEIDKLCLYSLGRPIEEDDVRSLSANSHEHDVFELIDRILQRRPAEATRLLHHLEEKGAAPPYLLFMITRQFRLVMQAKALLQQRHRPEEIGRILGVGRAYDALPKTIAQARSYSGERLEGVYRRLLDTDISIKTGRYRGDKGELALDLLVSELCGEAP